MHATVVLAHNRAQPNFVHDLVLLLEGGAVCLAPRLVLILLQPMATGLPQSLKGSIGKAEGILRLSEVCRKLETEAEKILPFTSLEEAAPLRGGKISDDSEEAGAEGDQQDHAVRV